MKKISTIIILFAISAIACKRPPLAFDRMPFLGNELQTDGFYYYTYYPNSQWDTTNRTYIVFLYKDGTISRGYTYNTVNIQDITIEMIKEEEKYLQEDSGSWGLFTVKDNIIYWSFWNYNPDFSTYVSFDSAEILNDTTFHEYRESNEGIIVDNTYHFHQFSYKPDSSVAYQWIP